MGGMRKIRRCDLHHLAYYFSEIVFVAVVVLQSGIRCTSFTKVRHKDKSKSIIDVFLVFKNNLCPKISYN